MTYKQIDKARARIYKKIENDAKLQAMYVRSRELNDAFHKAEHLSADWYSLREASREADSACYAYERTLMQKAAMALGYPLSAVQLA